jgi:F1F0 ATPase subunit 2
MKIDLAVSLIVGLSIGTFYFIGLWWTLRRLPAVGNPALWTFGSFVVRTAVCVSAFYLVMNGRWENLLMCLAGFTVMRLWLVRKLKPV